MLLHGLQITSHQGWVETQRRLFICIFLACILSTLYTCIRRASNTCIFIYIYNIYHTPSIHRRVTKFKHQTENMTCTTTSLARSERMFCRSLSFLLRQMRDSMDLFFSQCLWIGCFSKFLVAFAKTCVCLWHPVPLHKGLLVSVVGGWVAWIQGFLEKGKTSIYLVPRP